jgi:transposase
MAKRKLSMRKVKQILRLKLQADLSDRATARSVKASRDTVREYLDRAKAADLLTWDQIKDMAESDLEKLLFPPRTGDLESNSYRLPDWKEIHQELRRKGVTRHLLWHEYLQEDPATAYQYSQFCNLFSQWQSKLPAEMVQTYKGGEYLFVDYSGLTVPWTDRNTGEEKKAQIFVTALGASSYIYAEAQIGQALECWIKGHVNALNFLGGVPEVVVPDNLKSGVKSPSYYEPDINPTYDDLSLHYGFAVIPARVKKPRDKAKVETAVQVVERWVLAPLRNRQFFSIHEINVAIKPLLEDINNRQMKHLEKSRKELFEALDVPALKPLPSNAFEYAERKKARVGINYHVLYDKYYYSVPYTLIKEEVEVRATSTTVEIFHKGQRVASHIRSNDLRKYKTCSSHMPSEHQRRCQEWSPERFMRWAGKIGQATRTVITHLLGSRRHPEQTYRTCIGILKLSDKYSEERLEAACSRAADYELYSYRNIQNILKNGMEKAETQRTAKASANHKYVRGSKYYN